jgi:hypothetical protein
VAAETRVVVHDAEQHRLLPLAARKDDAAAGLVKIEVPERVDVAHLERAALARDEVGIELVAARPAAFSEAVLLHETAEARVARRWTERGIFSREHDEVVADELKAPARMLAAKPPDLGRHRLRHARMAAGMLGHFARQRRDGVLLVLGRVEPALDGFLAEAHGLTRGRVPPGAGRKLGDARTELARLGRRAQELSDDLKAQSCPAHARGRARVVAHVSPRQRDRARPADAEHPTRRGKSAVTPSFARHSPNLSRRRRRPRNARRRGTTQSSPVRENAPPA